MSDIKTPYLNGHMYEFDLCWLVEKILSFESQLNQAIDLKTIHYADPIQWDITTQYAPNTVVVDPKTGTAYMSKVPVPSGILLTNVDYWTVIFNYQDIYTKIMEGVAFYNGQSDYASKALLVNDLVWCGLDLYRVTKPIEEGGKLIPGTNLETTSIETVIKDIYDDLSTVMDTNTNDITYLQKYNIEQFPGTTTEDKLIYALDNIDHGIIVIPDSVVITKTYKPKPFRVKNYRNLTITGGELVLSTNWWHLDDDTLADGNRAYTPNLTNLTIRGNGHKLFGGTCNIFGMILNCNISNVTIYDEYDSNTNKHLVQSLYLIGCNVINTVATTLIAGAVAWDLKIDHCNFDTNDIAGRNSIILKTYGGYYSVNQMTITNNVIEGFTTTPFVMGAVIAGIISGNYFENNISCFDFSNIRTGDPHEVGCTFVSNWVVNRASSAETQIYFPHLDMGSQFIIQNNYVSLRNGISLTNLYNCYSNRFMVDNNRYSNINQMFAPMPGTQKYIKYSRPVHQINGNTFTHILGYSTLRDGFHPMLVSIRGYHQDSTLRAATAVFIITMHINSANDKPMFKASLLSAYIDDNDSSHPTLTVSCNDTIDTVAPTLTFTLTGFTSNPTVPSEACVTDLYTVPSEFGTI